MARPKKVHRYDYTIRTLAYYQQQGGIYNDIITILQKLRQTCTRDRIGTPASILNEATFIVDDSKTAGSDIIADMQEFKLLNNDRITSGTMDLIFACIYVLAFRDLTEGARLEVFRLMDHRVVDVGELFKLAESQEPQEELPEEHEQEFDAKKLGGLEFRVKGLNAVGIEKDGMIEVVVDHGPFIGMKVLLDPKVVSKYKLDAPPEYMQMLKDLTNQLAAKEKQLQELRKAMNVTDGNQQVRSYKADIKLLSKSLDSVRRELSAEKKKNEKLREERFDHELKSNSIIGKLTETCSLRELEKEKLRNEVVDLNKKLEDALANKTVDIKTVDDVLTFDYALQYIDDKEVYDEVKQLFEFLKRAMRRVATDEQYDQLDALEKKMLHNSLPSIHNHNQISNSNVFPGVVNNPNFPMGVGLEELQKMFVEFVNNMLNNGKQE